jgi:hypothetical protein
MRSWCKILSMIVVTMAMLSGPTLALGQTETKVTASDGAAGDVFGYIVSINGDYALVGARDDDDNGTDSGSVYVFQWTGSSWTEVAKLTADDAAAGDNFGSTVSLSGDYALVGANNNDDNGDNSGSAYIFHRVDETWNQTAKLISGDAVADDRFGQWVSLSNDFALIGARNDDENGNNSGSAYIFQRSGVDWNQVAKLTPDDGSDGDAFSSWAVSIDGDYALIGAPFDDDSGDNAGSAYVFQRVGAVWNQMAKLTPNDGAESDGFGQPVSLSGDYALIGSAADDDNGSNSGSAYLFHRDGAIWNQVAKLTSDDAAPDDSFGGAVSLDGDYALIGSAFDDDNGSSSGSAYLFHREGTDWNQITKLTASDGSGGDHFGEALSLDGHVAIVSARFDGDNGNDSGSAYVFQLPETGPVNPQMDKLYWTDLPVLNRSNLDGSQVETVLSENPTYFDFDVDLENEMIYWVDPGDDVVRRTDLDGTGPVETLVTGLSQPRGFALDVPGGKMYWTDFTLGTLQRSNLDGTNVELLLTGLLGPSGVELDVTNGKVYIGDGITEGNAQGIVRSNLDGSGLEVIVDDPNVDPRDIGLDLVHGKVYWADANQQIVGRANLDGSSVETFIPNTIDIRSVAVDPFNNKVYWADRGNATIFQANTDGTEVTALIENVLDPRTLRLILVPPSGDTLPSELVISRPFGAPGDTLALCLSLTSDDPVSGLQAYILPDSSQNIQFIGLSDTTMHPGFQVSGSVSGDTVRVVLFSTSGTIIAPGAETPIVKFLYRILPDAPLGSSIPVAMGEAVVGDSLGVALTHTTTDGELQIGIRGDVNMDATMSVLDAIQLVRILIGRDATPDSGSVSYNIADANGDGFLNVADVVHQINVILNIPPAISIKVTASPVTVTLDTPILLDGRMVVPLRFDSDARIAGLQASFTFDGVQTGSAILETGVENIGIASHTEGSGMTVIAYSLSAEKGINTILIPLSTFTEEGTLTLADLFAVDRQGNTIPVVSRNTHIQISEEANVPTVFSLEVAYPNPFNPITNIAYEVPEQSHITLVVYNMLGQEVARLVDQVQTAGRFDVLWNGTNSRGHAVSSGIYMYRLTSSTGYTETKKMTLLK